MGQRGPVPNRSEDLSRDRDADRGDRAPITRGQSRPAHVPEPDPDWHRVSRMLWDGALTSGHADFYESSDRAFLYPCLRRAERLQRGHGPPRALRDDVRRAESGDDGAPPDRGRPTAGADRAAGRRQRRRRQRPDPADDRRDAGTGAGDRAQMCGMRLAPGLMPAVPESGRPPMGAGRAANVSKRVCRLVRSANPAAGRTVDRLVTVGEAGWRCHC